MAISNSIEILKEILNRSNSYYKQIGLRPFILSLPLHGPAAQSNQSGIREKILKNRSYLITESNSKDDYTLELPDAVDYIHGVVDRLTSEDIVGFVLIIAEYLGPENSPPEPTEETVATSAYQYRPVAGGIVELLDQDERAIRGIWCRRCLSNDVSEALLKVTVMRLISHAFEWQYPNTSIKKSRSKLVSALEVHSRSFPRSTYEFLTADAGINLSRHWETQDDGGAHNDSPFQKCKCFKLAEKPEAWQFWGVSEGRFLKKWNAKRDEWIPNVVPQEVIDAFQDPRKLLLTKLKKPMPASVMTTSANKKIKMK